LERYISSNSKMVFETEFDVGSVQYADIIPTKNKGKCPERDLYATGWTKTVEESAQKAKASKSKSKTVKKPENPSWGPMYENRSHFTDMHVF